jgi:hypothetical protein
MPLNVFQDAAGKIVEKKGFRKEYYRGHRALLTHYLNDSAFF